MPPVMGAPNVNVPLLLPQVVFDGVKENAVGPGAKVNVAETVNVHP